MQNKTVRLNVGSNYIHKENLVLVHVAQKERRLRTSNANVMLKQEMQYLLPRKGHYKRVTIN
jgi:hypothetical protein